MQIPWWAKISAKLIFARIPIKRSIWRRIGVFRHGNMDGFEYAINVFRKHLVQSGFDSSLKGWKVLELGPGDGVATALIAASYGGESALIDVGSFANETLRPYLVLGEQLAQEGLNPPDLSCVLTVDDILKACNSEYLTCGLDSLKSVQDESIDLVFSHAVLEHVRVGEFAETMRECYRVMKPGAVASHRIDLRDHLGGGLNNLRIPSALWERDFFATSGFYTNRLSFSEIQRQMAAVGFDILSVVENRWPAPPIKRHQIAKEFRGRSDEELCVPGFDIVLRRIPQPSETGCEQSQATVAQRV